MRTCVVLSILLVLGAAAATSAAYIPGVTAIGSSEWNSSRGPGLVVDNSGMSQNIDGVWGHDNYWGNMWLSGLMSASYANPHPGTVSGSHWIEFNLQQAYAIDSMDIWNRSEENWPWYGMKDITVQYSLTNSADPADWTTIFIGTVPLSNGPWTPAALNVDFGGALAQFVVITSAKGTDVPGGTGDRNWFYDRGDYQEMVGLDEVRFYEIPEPVTMVLLGLGGLTLLRRRK